MKRLTSIVAFVFLVVSAALAQGNGGGNGGGGGGGGAPATGANAVIHDSTLTGTGLTASPLGLAAGAVTVSKLGTNNTAQAGQVLTFNGTQLSWQTPAANSTPGPLRIVDSLGNEVGMPEPISGGVYQAGVVRFIPSENMFVHFLVTTQGIVETPSYALYESTDCSGPGYVLFRNPQAFTQMAVNIGGTFYYPTGSPQMRTFRSFTSQTNPCLSTNDQYEAYDAAAVPVSAIGVPPFRFAR